MIGRDLSLLIGVGDEVFNQSNFRTYTVTTIDNNNFTCRDHRTDDLVDFDIATTTLTKIKRD